MGEYTQTVKELEAASFDFGLDDYPIFSEAYRETLNNKILAHYKYHEICAVDTDEFKHYLNTTMNEQMPLFNQLYQSELLSINPLLTFSRTETSVGENTVSSTGTSEGTQNRTAAVVQTDTSESASNAANKTTGKDIFSETPQGLLAAGDINGNVYATNARLTENNSTDTSGTDVENNLDRNETDATTTAQETASTTTGNVTNTTTASGYDRPLVELLEAYRKTFLNVDMQVINSLRDCFMQTY